MRPPLHGCAHHPTVVHAAGEKDRADLVGPHRTGHRRWQAREHDLRAIGGHTEIVRGNLGVRLDKAMSRGEDDDLGLRIGSYVGAKCFVHDAAIQVHGGGRAVKLRGRAGHQHQRASH